MHAHIGVGADGDHFQCQEQGAEYGELGGDALGRVDELGEEGGEDEDGFWIASDQPDFRPLDDCFRPILLKKSVSAFTKEKYASEIEIHILSRGYRTQISRSRVQK